MASCKAEWKWIHRLLPDWFDAVVVAIVDATSRGYEQGPDLEINVTFDRLQWLC